MSRGFSLVEVLVALAILSVGLLGAAALLLGGLRDQSLALRHGAASVLLADMAARIRANTQAGAAYDMGGQRSGGSSEQGSVEGSGEGSKDSPCDEASPCDAAALAAHDLAAFESAVTALLPAQHPRPRITYEPAIGRAAPSRYVISLGWDDPREPDAMDESTVILFAQPVAGEP